MASDATFVSSVLVDGPRKEVFKGIDSLADVGGGTGRSMRVIADVFPQIECAVLDLPHVVGGLEGCKNLRYVQGDMFEKVPPAEAVLLKLSFSSHKHEIIFSNIMTSNCPMRICLMKKWILHDWGDDECVRILKRCRDSISQRKNKGKVIIIDIVVGNAKAFEKTVETQLCFDMMIMMALVSGKEMTEGMGEAVQ